MALFDDQRIVSALVERFPTWDQLASANPSELAQCAGQRAASVRFPPRCPVEPYPGDGIATLSRWQPGFPSRLSDLADAPVLLYMQGNFPSRPCVTIGGAQFPSTTGVSAATAAAEICGRLGITVTAQADGGIGTAALRAVVASGGQAVAVAAADMARAGQDALLFRQIVENGGAVISEHGPGSTWTETAMFQASRLGAALGSAVVLIEVGLHAAGGAELVRASVHCGRFLIVPAGDTGCEALANSRSFSPTTFGTSARMEERLRTGQTPADAVISETSQLEAALRHACRPPQDEHR